MIDPTVGSGSLLLTVKKHLGQEVQKDLSYYGQEKNTATYNLTRMNLLLHGVRPEKMTIKNGDTLSYDWPEDPDRPNEGVLFDAVVMNPPYSAKNWNKSGLKISDPRFEIAGALPPDSKGDFAFLLHGLYHLGQSGAMAIVLPHGVLFRGSSEGEIRKRLIEKNYIDTIIGLPSNLFTNTGIPVCILILKKSRTTNDSILVIDASNSFIKVGKQNVLQEKDIAKIIDTYVERSEIREYSYLATREEVIKNEYNMNIPRYVQAIDGEIPQDVDGHLYGGIPEKNIAELKVLQSIAKDELDRALLPVRSGYYKLIKPISELSETILCDSGHVAEMSADIMGKSKEFIEKYWDALRKVDNVLDVHSLMEAMLIHIKDILVEFDFVDVYDGYQIIAELWKNALAHDAELIAGSDFYTIGRTRKPNMVIKGTGSKKREEQDGWVGAIVPNDLIKKCLYNDELKKIEAKNARIGHIDVELTELVEAAKIEDSNENTALYEALKKNEEDEPQDSFENKFVKAELKKAVKGTPEYILLKKLGSLIDEKSTLSKEIKIEEKELEEIIYERILVLTNKEINELVFEKWFGTTVPDLVNLVKRPLKIELATLEMLSERYAKTLSELDDECSELENALEALMSELVVI